jgi:predicted TIM-barrel fold metal-dependent hydrolase
VLWANKFDEIGLPSFLDDHWAPVYETANDLGLSINFHVGFANALGNTTSRGPEWAQMFDGAKEVAVIASGGMRSNGLAIAQLITSPLLDRFPDLKWVSVEAGAGYIPHLLDAVDWHWHGYGMHEKTNYKPSELFARQCYACFLYETSSLSLVGRYPDNFMFSTDFPHVQCIYPGPCSPALRPSEHVETYFGDLPQDLAQKVLTDNAANVYGVDVPAEWPARIPASATD